MAAAAHGWRRDRLRGRVADHVNPQFAAISTSATSTGPRRHRFARTLAWPRWTEYRRLLAHALQRGYRVISLERFVQQPHDGGLPCLILRHDVDQHPRSALRMAAIERAAGVTSTWYFRWRTADARVIRRLRREGFEVGFHYETLTRRLLVAGGLGPEAVDARMIDSCRAELRSEVSAFARRFGAITSICPHGDTRVPGVSNAILVADAPPDAVGGLIDSNEMMRGRGLAAWITDRSAPDGGWIEGADPGELLDALVSPMLCLTHPNNWAGGPGLLFDRLLSDVLPGHFPPAPIRTRRDRPLT